MDRMTGLELEAEYLYERLFRARPSQSVVLHYCQVHAERDDLMRADEAEARTVRLVAEKQLNPIAVELVVRRLRPRHLLSRKLLLLTYLAECSGRPGAFSPPAGAGRCPQTC
jgi:hypothetical protein